MPAKLASARLLAEGDARPDPEARQLAGGGGVRGAPMNGGEPEAGSEFAIGAAAAGEVRRGARDSGSQCVILGGQGESGPSARSFSFCPPSRTPAKFIAAPRPRNAPGSKGLTLLLQPRGLCYWGAASGGAGEVGNSFLVREGFVEYTLGWETPGSQPGSETFGKLLGLNLPNCKMSFLPTLNFCS